MLSILNVNSLVHWEEREILRREDFIRHFSEEVKFFLRSVNPAWDMRRIEAPTLIPRNMISDAYENADVWVQERTTETETELVLRPETTPSTYAYMAHLLDSHSGAKLPLCVWQAGRSYRREQEQTTAHMRLKEFWQLEFQAAFTADTGMDYHAACLEPVRKMIGSVIGLPTRIVESDRLPNYSQVTMDVEIDNGFKWMEVCSISRRTDFPRKFISRSKAGATREHDIFVLEIAIGLDRCLHNWAIASERT
ncbi:MULTISPECIES: aminoacyl--tRNA ligase-related protein [unclassified Rhizobium]|uniref:aminoacyl--tRNA ligase-related protein n=1 Tax=unclassified Rhizobium TaxID=2613769 RepID=UPI001AE2A615|nr:MULTISPECIES: aminoacyl--tRNA ligase-related protein [unclassified Rhizobium]MBP2461477.1 glycyl-tRNA synthetase [Rhizobium sp. PvP014]MBP2528873.1 glycyl-tRNA synthetase [Rhizobium sp. PvP099]